MITLQKLKQSERTSCDNCAELADSLREALVILHRLTRRLDEVSSHPSYYAVFQAAHERGIRYNGPSYFKEIQEAKAAIPEDIRSLD